ncbi:hypothetical protein GE061_011131 [Apolygus lucorum]|uniref:Ig-like domain-containing protein n=1 Tax=Apolygus lucorum TaxID=248454 RepID=A0A8S9XWG1_APOLU|nr:hypothetical protein GE061_011131 [Apolygus lucorum]
MKAHLIEVIEEDRRHEIYLHLKDKEHLYQNQQHQQLLELPISQRFNQNYDFLSYPPPPPPPPPPPDPPPPWGQSASQRNPCQSDYHASHNQTIRKHVDQQQQSTQKEQPQQYDRYAQHLTALQAQRQNPHYKRSVSLQQELTKDGGVPPQHTTSASQLSTQTTLPQSSNSQVNTYSHPNYNYTHPTSYPNLNPTPPDTPQSAHASTNYQALNHHQETPSSSQSCLYNVPPPNIDWSSLQHTSYASNTTQAPTFAHNYSIASTPSNVEASQASASAVATNVYAQNDAVNYSCSSNNNLENILTPNTPNEEGYSSLYGSQLLKDENRMVQTNKVDCYSQRNFNCHANRLSTNATSMENTASCIPATPLTASTPQASTSHNMQASNQPGFSPFNTQTNVNYFTGPGNVHGVYATQVQNAEDEEKRKTLAYIEEDNLKHLYLSEQYKAKLFISPNVSIEAQLNQDIYRQYYQGLNPNVRTMANMYGGININSAGLTHNFANYGVTNTSYDSPGFLAANNPYAIHHESYMGPPPPYPVPHVNRLAIDSARNEAKNAEAELTASQDRRKQAEEKIIAKEVGKRKLKARSQRMTTNQREAYLRFQYCGRATRNTQNYMNNSDEGLEEYLMQFELEEARNAEQRAAEKMRIAKTKLKAQLDEASRIEAAQTQHPPPAYSQNFNPMGVPMRQPPFKRGRRTHNYQAPCRRSNVPVHEYGQSSHLTPPPSYPGSSAAGHQLYQAPSQMGRNPPDYYQAVGPSPSNFRIQHPRRNVADTSYGSVRKQNSQCANQQYNVATAPQNLRRQAIQEMPQMSAPVSQQYYCTAQGNRYDSNNVHLREVHDPSSNVYKGNRYPVRQTRSTTRAFGETNSSSQDNRAPSRASNVFPNRPNQGSVQSTYNFPNYMTTTGPGAVLPTSNQTPAKPADGKGPALIDLVGGNSNYKQHSDQTDGNDLDNIENLVPTIPAIPNTIFEKCLKEMTPDIPKENPRTPGRMEAKVHSHAPFSTTSSSPTTTLSSFVGGSVQQQRPCPPVPSTSNSSAGTTSYSFVGGGVQQPRPSAPIPSTSHSTGTSFPSFMGGNVRPPRPSAPTPSTSHSNAGTTLSSFVGGNIRPPRPSAPNPSTSHPTATPSPSFVGGSVRPPRPSAPTPSTSHPYRRETRSTTRDQTLSSISKSNIEKELDQYFEQQANNSEGSNMVADDFSSEVLKLLEDSDMQF